MKCHLWFLKKIVDESIPQQAPRFENQLRRAQTEFESDKAYCEITESIIEISKEHLTAQRKSKEPLRRSFFIFFSVLLSVQYIVLVSFIVFNSFEMIPFEISEEILRLYIISVFVETLSAMAVMITFAFVSKDETKIVGVLNNIIENYQKVNLDKNDFDATDS